MTRDICQDPQFIEKALNIGATPSYMDKASWKPVLDQQNKALEGLLESLNLEKNK